jgi:hypothetical protein
LRCAEVNRRCGARQPDRAFAGAYHVNTMDVTAHAPNTRREGTMEGLSGADALAAVRNGHIWILLQQPHQLDSRYAEVSAFDLRRARVAGRGLQVGSFNHKMSILIASPKVQVYYHADVPGQVALAGAGPSASTSIPTRRRSCRRPPLRKSF